MSSFVFGITLDSTLSAEDSQSLIDQVIFFEVSQNAAHKDLNLQTEEHQKQLNPIILHFKLRGRLTQKDIESLDEMYKNYSHDSSEPYQKKLESLGKLFIAIKKNQEEEQKINQLNEQNFKKCTYLLQDITNLDNILMTFEYMIKKRILNIVGFASTLPEWATQYPAFIRSLNSKNPRLDLLPLVGQLKFKHLFDTIADWDRQLLLLYTFLKDKNVNLDHLDQFLAIPSLNHYLILGSALNEQLLPIPTEQGLLSRNRTILDHWPTPYPPFASLNLDSQTVPALIKTPEFRSLDQAFSEFKLSSRPRQAPASWSDWIDTIFLPPVAQATKPSLAVAATHEEFPAVEELSITEDPAPLEEVAPPPVKTRKKKKKPSKSIQSFAPWTPSVTPQRNKPLLHLTKDALQAYEILFSHPHLLKWSLLEALMQQLGGSITHQSGSARNLHFPKPDQSGFVRFVLHKPHNDGNVLRPYGIKLLKLYLQTMHLDPEHARID